MSLAKKRPTRSNGCISGQITKGRRDPSGTNEQRSGGLRRPTVRGVAPDHSPDGSSSGANRACDRVPDRDLRPSGSEVWARGSGRCGRRSRGRRRGLSRGGKSSPLQSQRRRRPGASARIASLSWSWRRLRLQRSWCATALFLPPTVVKVGSVPPARHDKEPTTTTTKSEIARAAHSRERPLQIDRRYRQWKTGCYRCPPPPPARWR